MHLRLAHQGIVQQARTQTHPKAEKAQQGKDNRDDHTATYTCQD